MNIRADVNTRFFLRFILIAIICIGFFFWALYDGIVAYPNQLTRILKYKDLEKWVRVTYRKNNSGQTAQKIEVIIRGGGQGQQSIRKTALQTFIGRVRQIEDNGQIRVKDFDDQWETFEYNDKTTIIDPQGEKISIDETLDLVDTWETVAKENSWPIEKPDENKVLVKTVEDIKNRYDWKIKSQFVMIAVAAPVGFFSLWVYLGSRGRWLEADNSGITSSWGQQFAFDNILTLDKKQWKNKGIARITYDAEGHTKKFVLDNYKFNRWAIDDILLRVESQITDNQIIGGCPEPLAQEKQEVLDSGEVVEG
ncbi:MAG: hypothetical protein CMJ81_17580 [Planctomycetaceae bacterium]|nr:hypothetical protein [Planctomycetaceae bacterium]